MEYTTWPSLSHPLKLSHFSEATGTFPTPQSWYCISKMDSNLHLMLEATLNEDFPLINKVMILRQAAQGLVYLHSHSPKLVHHDLSPNNILVNEVTYVTKPTKLTHT